MSFNGLTTIKATNIQNQLDLRVGNQVNPGTAGQYLQSGGPNQPCSWDTITIPPTLTAGNGINITGTTVSTDNDNLTINNTGGTGTQNQVLKVPNPLIAGTNISFSSGTRYDGSAGITIGANNTDNQLNLTGALPIVINNLGGFNREVELQYDTNTLGAGGGALEVLKVPNILTAGTNISMVNTVDGAAATTYDGSEGITINGSGTTYQGGTNISIDTSTTPDSINLDVSIMNQTLIMFNQTGITTAIIGSAYPNNPTRATYLDLSSALNITSPYCFHNVYGTASTDFDSLTTSYAAGSILGALGTSITAKQTALCVEVIVYNYAISSNRDTDMRLVDKSGSEWSVGISEGGAGTGTIQTAREVHRADETDRQIVHQTWSITGLTIGNTYTFNPQARTSATSNFLAAGGSYPDAFFRGYYLPS